MNRYIIQLVKCMKTLICKFLIFEKYNNIKGNLIHLIFKLRCLYTIVRASKSNFLNDAINYIY